MLKRLYLAAAISLVILAACGSNTPPTAMPTPTLTLTPIPEIPTFSLDTQKSIINYQASGAFNASFPGTFNLESGTIQLISKSDGTHVTFDVVIDGNSVTAVNDLVKNALKSNLETDKYPKGHFVAESREAIQIGAQSIKVIAVGKLTLHNQTQNVEMPFTLIISGDKLVANGEMMLDLFDYKVNVPTAILSSKIKFSTTVMASKGLMMATAAATP